MIFYTHVNEDNAVERDQMMRGSFERLFCIAGSGERVIALLDHPSLKNVHVIDNNVEALFLTELKLVALQCLPVKDYLSFIGSGASREFKPEMFRDISSSLSASCRNFWSKRYKILERGVLSSGHFEQFLQRIRPLLKIGLGIDFYQSFRCPKKELKNFPVFRWGLVKYFFSRKWAYIVFGMRDEAFISNDACPKIIPRALQKSLDEDTVSQSCIFHLVFLGHLDDMPGEFRPASMQVNILSKIKDNIAQDRIKVHYHLGDVQKVLRNIDYNKNDKCFYSLSDLLSFESMEYMKDMLEFIARNNLNQSVIVFRTFLRNRLSSEHFENLQKKYLTVRNLTAQERTNLYQVVCINLIS